MSHHAYLITTNLRKQLTYTALKLICMQKWWVNILQEKQWVKKTKHSDEKTRGQNLFATTWVWTETIWSPGTEIQSKVKTVIS